MRKLLIGLAAPALIVAGTSTAWAHTTLLDGSPGPGDKVAPGAEVIALRFGEALDPSGKNEIALLDADDKGLPISAAKTATDASYLCARIDALEPGVHTIRYDVTSEDGHPVRGNYEFEVAEGGEQADPMACDVSTLDEPADAKSLSDQEQDDFPMWAVWLLAGVAVLAAALAAVAVVRSRREDDDEDDAPKTDA
ncbi:copper resistance CopC family protein [Nocardioides dubius]|uniref:Copper resistance protein CopC n=1 Tax=Nocardioides dubius TaxID=317019 RepID=A0ABP4EFD6_9ACTN